LSGLSVIQYAYNYISVTSQLDLSFLSYNNLLVKSRSAMFMNKHYKNWNMTSDK